MKKKYYIYWNGEKRMRGTMTVLISDQDTFPEPQPGFQEVSKFWYLIFRLTTKRRSDLEFDIRKLLRLDTYDLEWQKLSLETWKRIEEEMAKNDIKTKLTLYWRDGERQVVSGASAGEALIEAGFNTEAIAEISFIANGDDHDWIFKDGGWVKKAQPHLIKI
jgi:hypothetical protein